MRRVLAAVLNVVGKSIAAGLATLFVVVTALVLLLSGADRALLSARTYKRALAKERVYERMPDLVAEQVGALTTFLANPCAENALGCSLDGASPELQACLLQALGQEAYEAIGSGRRKPTAAELLLAQPCLDRFAGWPKGENPLPSAAPEVRACARQAVGDAAYAALASGQRPPTAVETRRMAPCLEQSGGPAGIAGLAGGQMAFMNNLTQQDWRRLVGALLPPDDLQRMTEGALEQVLAYVDGDVDTATVSLAALKARLTGQAGRDVLRLLVTAQPPCTPPQLAQMAAVVAGGQGEMVLCNPPPEKLATLLSDMQKRVDSLVTQIPDQAVIIKPPAASAPTTGGGPAMQSIAGPDARTSWRNARRAARLSPLLSLGLLLLVALFGVRSLRGWLGWWGVSLLFAGLIALGVGIATLPVLNWAWVTTIVVRMPSYVSESSASLGRDLLNGVARTLVVWIVFPAGAVILVGLAGILGSACVRSRSKAAPPTL